MERDDDMDGLREDLDYLSHSSLRPRFKSSIDLNNFFSTGTARFEVDNDGIDGFLEDEYEEEEKLGDSEEGLKHCSQARSYVKTHQKANRPLASNNPLIDFSFDSFIGPTDKEEIIADGTIRKMVVKQGTGVLVPDNCKVYVHYICKAEEMEDVYDSTVMRATPHCIDLRNRDVIIGLFLAIKSMEVGEVAKFIIKFELAFGVVGCPPRIPPSSDIHCIVEVLAVIDEEKLNSIPYMSQGERAQLTFKEIYDATKTLRMEGNGLYRNMNYWKSIKKYRKGVNVLEDYPVICNEDEKQRQELLYTIYCNLAQCYLKVHRPQQACVACQLGLRCHDKQGPSCSKIFYRFAEAKLLLGGTEDALRLCKQGSVRDATNMAFGALEKKILSKQKEDEKISKMTYKAMSQGLGSSSPVKGKENQGINDGVKDKAEQTSQESMEQKVAVTDASKLDSNDSISKKKKEENSCKSSAKDKTAFHQKEEDTKKTEEASTSSKEVTVEKNSVTSEELSGELAYDDLERYIQEITAKMTDSSLD